MCLHSVTVLTLEACMLLTVTIALDLFLQWEIMLTLVSVEPLTMPLTPLFSVRLPPHTMIVYYDRLSSRMSS